MAIKLTVLGCHSATPREGANPTAQLLEINNHYFLIDCGEGTQVQLRKQKIRFSKIKHIFISHLHGDHYFGLIGLVNTFGLLGRKTPLHIYGPKGIEDVILLQLKLANAGLGYALVFHDLESKASELIFDDHKVTVHTIPLSHRIYANGFLFKEKLGERKLNIEAVKKHPEIEICDYQNLKSGKDFVKNNGVILSNKSLTLDPPLPKSYAFCSDTAYQPSVVPIIKNADLLYHEATFLDDNLHLAKKTGHSTAKQAAEIAKKAAVKQLMIGHYSSRYNDISAFKTEAEAVFKSVILAETGKIVVLK